MKWVSVKERLPEKEGKYVVWTKSTSKFYTSRNRFETRFMMTDDKGRFDVSNQIVEFWLDEPEVRTSLI